MVPLYDLLAVFKKEHDAIKSQKKRQSIHSRILTRPERKTKTSKVSNEVDLYIFLFPSHCKTWSSHFFRKLWPNNGREHFKNYKA